MLLRKTVAVQKEQELRGSVPPPRLRRRSSSWPGGDRRADRGPALGAGELEPRDCAAPVVGPSVLGATHSGTFPVSTSNRRMTKKDWLLYVASPRPVIHRLLLPRTVESVIWRDEEPSTCALQEGSLGSGMEGASRAGPRALHTLRGEGGAGRLHLVPDRGELSDLRCCCRTVRKRVGAHAGCGVKSVPSTALTLGQVVVEERVQGRPGRAVGSSGVPLARARLLSEWTRVRISLPGRPPSASSGSGARGPPHPP